jgi:hypothetical protein
VTLAMLQFMPWGNYVDHCVYMSGLSKIFPISWMLIQKHGYRSFNAFPKRVNNAITRHLHLPLGQWHASSPLFIREKVPMIRDLFDQRIGKSTTIPNVCAIHLRMGDVPYARHKNYKLPKLSSIYEAKSYVSKHVQTFVLLCSTKHRSNPQYSRASLELASMIADKVGAKLLMNRTEEEDLRTLRDAESRITFNSSFSFYAAVASTGQWINVSRVQMKGLRENVIDLQENVLEHSKVLNYLDSKKVMQQLLIP